MTLSTDINNVKTDKNEILNKTNNEEAINTRLENEKLIPSKEIGTDYSYKHDIAWDSTVKYVSMHMLGAWGLFILLQGVKYQTLLWTISLFYLSLFGITVGAHRWMCHKSFKAKPLLKVILLLWQTLAGQYTAYFWCLNHRLHHRYSDTDGDPHNSKRGFFFCHIGWLMHKPHPYVKKLAKTIDMSDLKADRMIMFQKKYFYPLYFLVGFFIPVFVPCYFWGETIKKSVFVCYFLRYVLSLNVFWSVNSLAHLYGTRPYDKNLMPVDSWFVSMLATGEGWHNYHHTFPWDYKAAEFSTLFNGSARLIELFNDMGLAYDLKAVSQEMLAKRIRTTGDGTHFELGNEEDKKAVTAIGPLHPLNPSYNVTYKRTDGILGEEGLPYY